MNVTMALEAVLAISIFAYVSGLISITSLLVILVYRYFPPCTIPFPIESAIEMRPERTYSPPLDKNEPIEEEVLWSDLSYFPSRSGGLGVWIV